MESGNAAGLLGRQLHSFVLEGRAKIKWFQCVIMKGLLRGFFEVS
jgi:hypothetical protein